MPLTPSEFRPETMNIELTTVCPLRCPQCYCSLAGGKHIDLQTAVYWIREGGKHGVKTVMLSGGETLCYPYIYDVVAAANEYCGIANVALSGFGLTQDVLNKLIAAGVGGIFISLNGSTKAINAQTRDGFDLAISALGLLNENRCPNTYINWVMHHSNSDDFKNVIKIAEKYSVKNLVVMALKPDSDHKLLSTPTKEQMLSVKQVIRTYSGSIKILVESCYSPMLALMHDTRLFGNLNAGKNKGCIAGRYTFSVNVDGKLSPCRHLEYFEEYSRLDDYWNTSELLHKLRGVERNKKMPCSSCKYGNFCRHCLAVNSKTKGDLYIGHDTCPLQE